MGVFALRKCFRFEAAHYLPHHEGKCRRLHGHSWVAWVDVAGSELQTSGSETGMVMDLGAISDRVKPMVEQYLDHYCLNDTLPLESPTSEALAQWIYEHLNRHCRLPVSAVTIEETCTSACTYRV